ncbi:MAG: polysaccharide pyruvyl transferase family protein [Opitutales bacterium]|nr:polysaccharide pyruvyl transferase family protein [Opitutales bacterium]
MKSLIKKYLPAKALSFLRFVYPMSCFRILIAKIIKEWRIRRIVHYCKLTEGDKRAYLFFVPEHGNIGDQAIVVAEREFFKRYLPDVALLEIPENIDRPVAARIFATVHSNKEVVTMHGGGWLGNLWIPWDYVIKGYYEVFKDKRIVMFPNTFFFEKKGDWQEEIVLSREGYERHRDLHVFIRDKSLDFTREQIMPTAKERVYSVPDIVLSLDRSSPKFEREGVLLCFRSDKEKVVPAETLDKIMAILRSRGESCSRTDTVQPYAVPSFAREIEVEKKFDEFRRSRLVITDRLHGMIFATITGTPCIAVNNISKKVQGVWELWIKDRFPYVKFVENADEIPDLLDEMLALGAQHYDPSIFEAYWRQLADVVRGGIK